MTAPVHPLPIEDLAGLAMCCPDSAHLAGCRTLDEEVAWFAARLRRYGRAADEEAIRATLIDRDEQHRRDASHAVRIYP